ncbi:uracil-DNA glycosylase [Candidatus Saccharibacteria bacterium]|nr:uracil-DNA glycosylase [Candidatus Saccharibacteria bacterium]
MHSSWKSFLDSEFAKPYFQELSAFLSSEYKTKTIFPPKSAVFRAFQTDFNQIKVVILGQDPYHTPGAAMGLAFSVPSSEKIPPSLINIYKEIDSDLGQLYADLKIMNPNLILDVNNYKHHNSSGDLSNWASQGVLLLNNVLTVEAHLAGSHRGHGWETFTENVIKHLSDTREHLVYILWGRDARSKRTLIDASKNLILESAHPSPLSAHNGFFGSRPFTRANAYLKSHGQPEIIW